MNEPVESVLQKSNTWRYVPPVNTEADFWPRVDKTSTCWNWIGCMDKKQGYGWFWSANKMILAHRYAYALAHGPIPKELVCDHICRNRACVNPAHIRLISNKENILIGVCPSAINARKTHCKRGHPFDEENTIRRKTGRGCNACYQAWRKARREAGIKW